MKKFLLSLDCLFDLSVYGQITSSISIVEPSNLSSELNSSTIDVTGLASDFELYKALWLVNNTNQAITLKCKKIEVDVLSGTENVTCWKICPMNYDVAGANQSAFVTVGGNQMTETLAANGSGLDTNKSFTAHYKPMNIDGCSLMRYEWYDENDLNTPLAAIDIRFIHTTGNCSVSDNISFSKPEFKLFPNPADDLLRIKLDVPFNNMDNYTLSIVDVIGKKVEELNINSFGSSTLDLKVKSLKQGIYMVSLSTGNSIVQTQRLIIKH